MANKQVTRPVEEKEFSQTVEFNVDEIPEIKNWKVGGRYKLLIDVEQLSLKNGDMFDENQRLTATFKIRNVGVEEEESFESEYARKYNKAHNKNK